MSWSSSSPLEPEEDPVAGSCVAVGFSVADGCDGDGLDEGGASPPKLNVLTSRDDLSFSMEAITSLGFLSLKSNA